MSPTEIAIYAVETKAIIHILWGLLLISAITLVSVSIMYASLRVRLRSQKRRESHFARLIAARAAEIKALEEQLAQAAAVKEPAVADLKAEVRRATAIRARTEERLVEQNAEMATLREQLVAQSDALKRLGTDIDLGRSA